jgi:hypothetical protein
MASMGVTGSGVLRRRGSLALDMVDGADDRRLGDDSGDSSSEWWWPNSEESGMGDRLWEDTRNKTGICGGFGYRRSEIEGVAAVSRL